MNEVRECNCSPPNEPDYAGLQPLGPPVFHIFLDSSDVRIKVFAECQMRVLCREDSACNNSGLYRLKIACWAHCSHSLYSHNICAIHPSRAYAPTGCPAYT